MNTILLIHDSKKLIRFTWYEESANEMAWKEFQRELKAAPSEVTVRYMTEQEFLKMINP
jgi:predicted nucleic acid-binding protein